MVPLEYEDLYRNFTCHYSFITEAISGPSKQIITSKLRTFLTELSLS